MAYRCGEVHDGVGVSCSAIQQLAELACKYLASLGPGSWEATPSAIRPAASMWEHWPNSFAAVHALQRDPVVEPGIQQCIDLQRAWGHRLPALRRQAVQELQASVEDRAEATAAWWAALPAHIRLVYQDYETGRLTQIPLFVELLSSLGYPDVATLDDELNNGREH